MALWAEVVAKRGRKSIYLKVYIIFNSESTSIELTLMPEHVG